MIASASLIRLGDYPVNSGWLIVVRESPMMPNKCSVQMTARPAVVANVITPKRSGIEAAESCELRMCTPYDVHAQRKVSW